MIRLTGQGDNYEPKACFGGVCEPSLGDRVQEMRVVGDLTRDDFLETMPDWAWAEWVLLQGVGE